MTPSKFTPKQGQYLAFSPRHSTQDSPRRLPHAAERLPYKDLGVAYLDTISVTVVKANLVKRLERLGYRVKLEALAT